MKCLSLAHPLAKFRSPWRWGFADVFQANLKYLHTFLTFKAQCHLQSRKNNSLSSGKRHFSQPRWELSSLSPLHKWQPDKSLLSQYICEDRIFLLGCAPQCLPGSAPPGWHLSLSYSSSWGDISEQGHHPWVPSVTSMGDTSCRTGCHWHSGDKGKVLKREREEEKKS